MRSKRYSTSSSSSDDEALIVLKQEKEPNSYHSLRKKSSEQCEFCDEEFSDRYSLFQHNITHMIVPVVKLNLYQCRDCRNHFKSNEDLDSHMLKYHNKLIIKPISNNVKEKVPDILKSLVEKQLVVKCEDDINLFVSNKITKNCRKEKSDSRNPVESKRDNETIRGTKNDSNNIYNTQNIEIVNKDVKNDNTKPKKDSKIYNDGMKSAENGEVVKRAPNIIIVEMSPPPVAKIEPFSPPVKERASSPLEDDKESIRHRLLFEEDIEDTLFRDISNECHVNIDTLCQELDLDDTLVDSDSDDSLGLYSKARDNAVNNSQNQMNIYDIEENNFEIIPDYSRENLVNGTGFEHETNMTNGINNSGHGMNNCESAVNNCESAVNNFEDQIPVFKVSGSHSINLEALNIIENENDDEKNEIEVKFGNSIHYDDLNSPDVCYCKYCGKQFFNRFELIQHEPTHILIKKPHYCTPLCCLCERYIAGNHYSLKKHLSRQHPEHSSEVTYSTKNCPKCALKYHNYSKHLKNHHEAYKCDDCLARFETFRQKNTHICGETSNFVANSLNSTFDRKSEVPMDTFAVMQLCDLCFSFMKIYMQNRHNYEDIGTKTELGVRQTCDKCNKEFFSVNLVKRKPLRPVIDKEGRMTENRKSDVCQMASDGLKAGEFGQKTADFGQKAAGFGQKVDKKVDFKAKMRTKPLSNKERLVKIQQRLKLMKMINKR